MVWTEQLWSEFFQLPELEAWALAADCSNATGKHGVPDGTSVIYALVEDLGEEQKTRYIGVTRTDIETRFRGHKKDAASSKHDRKSNWLRSRLDSGVRVYPLEIVRVPQELEELAEQAYIGALRWAGEDLVNYHAGGNGGPVNTGPWEPTEAWIAARRATRGAKRTEESRQRISDGVKRAYAEGKIQLTAEQRSESAKKALESRRKNVAAGITAPWVGYNKGKKMPEGTGKRISESKRAAAEARGFKSQIQLMTDMAEELGVTMWTVRRALKTPSHRPTGLSPEIEKLVMDAYERSDKRITLRRAAHG